MQWHQHGLCCILQIFYCWRSSWGKGSFVPLLRDKLQQPLWINFDLCQWYCWYKSELICAGGSGPGRGLEFSVHCHLWSLSPLEHNSPVPPHLLLIPFNPLPLPHRVPGLPILAGLYSFARVHRKVLAFPLAVGSLECHKEHFMVLLWQPVLVERMFHQCRPWIGLSWKCPVDVGLLWCPLLNV